MRIHTMLLGVAAFIFASFTAAQAHHSFYLYDLTKSVTLAGTVVKVDYAFPHTWTYLLTDDGVSWSIESGGPNQLTRVGWMKNSIKPGDKVVFSVAPSKDGGKVGFFTAVTLADGKKVER